MADLKRESLQQEALQFDLDPAGDYAKPGNSPPERAFQVLWCAFDLILSVTEVGFPSYDRRTCKRTAKWVKANLLYQAAQTSSILAHALPSLLVETDGSLSWDGSEPDDEVVGAEHHARLLTSIADFYPLVAWRKSAIEVCLGEFKVLETHKPRPEVAKGDEIGSEYSEALLRGENPDDDPRLVEVQRRYAFDYFFNRASVLAMTTALAQDYGLVEDKLACLWKSNDDPRIPAYLARARAAWVEGSRSYREYALLDSKSSG
jgi:hypothetical protein